MTRQKGVMCSFPYGSSAACPAGEQATHMVAVPAEVAISGGKGELVPRGDKHRGMVNEAATGVVVAFEDLPSHA